MDKQTLICKVVEISGEFYFIQDSSFTFIIENDFFIKDKKSYRAGKKSNSSGYRGMYCNDVWLYDSDITNKVVATTNNQCHIHNNLLPKISNEFVKLYHNNLNNPISTVELLMTSSEVGHELIWEIVVNQNGNVIIDNYKKKYTSFELLKEYFDNRTVDEIQEDKNLIEKIHLNHIKEINKDHVICVNCKRVFVKKIDTCYECGGKTFTKTLADITDDDVKFKYDATQIIENSKLLEPYGDYMLSQLLIVFELGYKYYETKNFEQ